MVNVFYNELLESIIEEEELFPLTEFLSEIANVIGLYFGFSIISAGYLVTRYTRKYYRQRRSKERSTRQINYTLKEIVKYVNGFFLKGLKAACNTY